MLVPLLLFLFAWIVVLLGGGRDEVIKLYYDADFNALYDTKDTAEQATESAEENTKIDVDLSGLESLEPERPAPSKIPVDAELLAEDIYSNIIL